MLRPALILKLVSMHYRYGAVSTSVMRKGRAAGRMGEGQVYRIKNHIFSRSPDAANVTGREDKHQIRPIDSTGECRYLSVKLLPHL